jgi:hypothetical protein
MESRVRGRYKGIQKGHLAQGIAQENYYPNYSMIHTAIMHGFHVECLIISIPTPLHWSERNMICSHPSPTAPKTRSEQPVVLPVSLHGVESVAKIAQAWNNVAGKKG